MDKIGMRKRDRFDGENSCVTCRRKADGTCPAGYETKPEDMICNYYKIITPAFVREWDSKRLIEHVTEYKGAK